MDISKEFMEYFFILDMIDRKSQNPSIAYAMSPPRFHTSSGPLLNLSI